MAGKAVSCHDPRLAGVRIAVDARTLRRPGMGIHSYLSAGVKILLREGADVVLLTNFSRDEYRGGLSGSAMGVLR